ncbi:nucleotidyltransferase domain-containing protein [Sorangium sp. So ce131]|uniref:nucleotidyltransferase domain-containing protein n=1 Tax=Sorangium sp. So ce131 TaxID=3133282 RepID=UPI003F5F4621
MPRNWDQTLKDWAETINATDEARGSRAHDAVREAILSATKLAHKRIDVFVTGSYRNNTNTRADSDIDVAVVLRDAAFYEVPDDSPATRARLHLPSADESVNVFSRFRDDVAEALRARFGASNVSAGNKAFDVRASGDRLEADVAVFLEHRRCTGKRTANGQLECDSGVELRPRSAPAQRIINWPEQHDNRGIAKNKATNGRFKRMVRIFKHLRADMAAQGDAEQKSAAGQVRAFVLECLVYNAPDEHFNQQDGGYLKDTEAVLGWLLRATQPGVAGHKLTEVSGMQPLFYGPAQRTPQQAYAFLKAAWRRVFGAKELPR